MGHRRIAAKQSDPPEQVERVPQWWSKRSEQTTDAVARLENDRIQAERIYQPLIRWMCLAFRGEQIYLALDSSVWWERFVTVRVALIYRAKALPLSWVVLNRQSATVVWEKYEVILERAARVLPVPCDEPTGLHTFDEFGLRFDFE